MGLLVEELLALLNFQIDFHFGFSNGLQVPNLAMVQVPNFQMDCDLDFQTDFKNEGE